MFNRFISGVKRGVKTSWSFTNIIDAVYLLGAYVSITYLSGRVIPSSSAGAYFLLIVFFLVLGKLNAILKNVTKGGEQVAGLGYITCPKYHDNYEWWTAFLSARMQLIVSMVALGKSDAEIMHSAGITDRVQFEGLKEQAMERLSKCK